MNNKGFEIRHNGVPRTFRDRKDVAANSADIIEIVDCSTGTNVIMLADGRTG